MEGVENDVNPKYFEGDFTVASVDEEGQQFSNVSRFRCIGGIDGQSVVRFDANVHIFGLSKDEQVYIALESEIPEEPEKYYHYVMNGLIFKYEENEDHSIAKLYVSCGGLLIEISSNVKNLTGIPRGRHVFFCIRKHSE